nr:hypothetical protein GTC16762_08410 [Pigmentibacter ruber]
MSLQKIESYGVLKKNIINSEIDIIVEEVKSIGYSILNPFFSDLELKNFSDKFNEVREKYIKVYKEEFLREIDEYNSIRLPLLFDKCFLDLAMNQKVLQIVSSLIHGKFILNQQNGVINPSNEKYNQGLWHRDLPYQHFISSTPIAINALFCLDEFTIENGATYVLPFTHKQEPFPSDHYITKNSKQITAPAGAYIILDCMTFHKGGYNSSSKNRRAINHVYTIPYIKQQIDMSGLEELYDLDSNTRDLLGMNYPSPNTIQKYLDNRKLKII